MSNGILEDIAAQLKALNLNLRSVLDSDVPIPGRSTDVTSVDTDSEADSGTTAPKKKAASKKKAVSKKKASAKKKSDDLSDITVFKRRLFEVAQECNVSEPVPALKAFFEQSDYESSDEVEVDDRATFVDELTAYLSEGDEGKSDDDMDF